MENFSPFGNIIQEMPPGSFWGGRRGESRGGGGSRHEGTNRRRDPLEAPPPGETLSSIGITEVGRRQKFKLSLASEDWWKIKKRQYDWPTQHCDITIKKVGIVGATQQVSDINTRVYVKD